MVHPINQDELTNLSLPSLVQRMDEILIVAERERYSRIPDGFPLVSDVIKSRTAQSLPEDARRNAAHIAFAYLVQMELYSISGGIGNKILYTEEFDHQTSWLSPSFQLRDGALRQYQIVASRMAMEIFMDLLYFIDAGGRLQAKRSKLKKFREWLCQPANPFHYFAHVLLEAYRFDRAFRTPEVHGTPTLPKRLLLLQTPSHEQLNEPNGLHNALLNCWPPMLQILDGERPQHMGISEEHMAWFWAYMTGSEDEIKDRLSDMFDDIE